MVGYENIHVYVLLSTHVYKITHMYLTTASSPQLEYIYILYAPNRR